MKNGPHLSRYKVIGPAVEPADYILFALVYDFCKRIESIFTRITRIVNIFTRHILQICALARRLLQGGMTPKPDKDQNFVFLDTHQGEAQNQFLKAPVLLLHFSQCGMKLGSKTCRRLHRRDVFARGRPIRCAFAAGSLLFDDRLLRVRRRRR